MSRQKQAPRAFPIDASLAAPSSSRACPASSNRRWGRCEGRGRGGFVLRTLERPDSAHGEPRAKPAAGESMCPHRKVFTFSLSSVPNAGPDAERWLWFSFANWVQWRRWRRRGKGEGLLTFFCTALYCPRLERARLYVVVGVARALYYVGGAMLRACEVIFDFSVVWLFTSKGARGCQRDCTTDFGNPWSGRSLASWRSVFCVVGTDGPPVAPIGKRERLTLRSGGYRSTGWPLRLTYETNVGIAAILVLQFQGCFVFQCVLFYPHFRMTQRKNKNVRI